MALSATQRAQIRRLLGYSERFGDTLATAAQRIEAAMDSLSAANEVEVTALLGTTSDAATVRSLLAVENAITAQRTRRKALAVGSIKLNPLELHMLRSEGSALLGQLASVLGVAIQSNPFYPSAGSAAFQTGRNMWPAV
jgi:hypothetical protein